VPGHARDLKRAGRPDARAGQPASCGKTLDRTGRELRGSPNRFVPAGRRRPGRGSSRPSSRRTRCANRNRASYRRSSVSCNARSAGGIPVPARRREGRLHERRPGGQVLEAEVDRAASSTVRRHGHGWQTASAQAWRREARRHRRVPCSELVRWDSRGCSPPQRLPRETRLRRQSLWR
jgi:hypothetical protein